MRVPSSDLAAIRSGREQPEPDEYDLVRTEYKIARHPEIVDPEEGYEIPLGLARVEISVPRADVADALEDEEQIVGAGEEADDRAEALFEEAFLGDDEDERGADLGPDIEWEELYAPEILYLRFCYYDGSTWWDDWDITVDNPLPQLVMVTIGFEGHAPFGEEFGRSINEEFCECLTRDPVDCEPLAEDQYSMVVRVPLADPLFRSRVSREAQEAVRALQGEDAEERE
jgi:hypothetical protein